MVITFQSKNIPRDSSLNIYKVWTCLSPSVAANHMFFSQNFICLFSGEAESGLERLHQCAEKELQVYLDAESPMKDFNDFRTKLAGLTR